MSKLKEITLHQLTKDKKTLFDILNICNQHQDICRSVPEFWKEKLTKLFGKYFVLKRGDLVTGNDWYNFVKSITSGIEYRYGIQVSIFDHQKVIRRRLFASRILETGYGNPILSGTIDGILPKEGTPGYFVELHYESDHHDGRINEIFFYEGNENETFKIVLSYLADKIVELFNPNILGTVEEITTDEMKEAINNKLIDEVYGVKWFSLDMYSEYTSDFDTYLSIDGCIYNISI
uniref:Uncharacterized protein n=1 Tax=Pithovirus LCPAC302 TaxID=2506593 RepID=A0A481Z6Y1_9VIRU|nr:MAG: protein of unknown function DUF2167 [Pithovirus LCPAC302]